MFIEELAPDMGPAGGFRYFPRLEDGVEPGIAVGVENALEALQVAVRMLAFAVWRIEVGGGRRALAAMGPAVADIGP